MTTFPTDGVRKFEGVSEFNNGCRSARLAVGIKESRYQPPGADLAESTSKSVIIDEAPRCGAMLRSRSGCFLALAATIVGISSITCRPEFKKYGSIMTRVAPSFLQPSMPSGIDGAASSRKAGCTMSYSSWHDSRSRSASAETSSLDC